MVVVPWLLVMVAVLACGLMASYTDIKNRLVSDYVPFSMFLIVLVIKSAFLPDVLLESAFVGCVIGGVTLAGYLVGYVGSGDIFFGSAMGFALGGSISLYGLMVLVTAGTALWVFIFRLHIAITGRALRKTLLKAKNIYLLGLLLVAAIYWIIITQHGIALINEEMRFTLCLPYIIAFIIMAYMLSGAGVEQLPLNKVDDTYRLSEVIIVKDGVVKRIPKTGIALFTGGTTVISGALNKQKKEMLSKLIKQKKIKNKFTVVKGDPLLPGFTTSAILITIFLFF